MAGKKKKKVAKKVTKKRASNFKGRIPGAKNKPKPKVYRVINEHSYILGDFATVDAACDAIKAQAGLHSALRIPVPVEVSEDEIAMMAEGEQMAHEPVMGGLMEFDWTIVVRRQEPGDTVHPEW